MTTTHRQEPLTKESTVNLAVKTRDLSKQYEGRIAVDQLNLRVRQGEVYGFLGPNGAGKTTTLRMLLGLIAPTSGTAVVAGGSPGSAESLDQVGAMIEQPGFYPYLSGAENLRLLSAYSRVEPSRAAVILLFEPVVAGVIGYWVGERLGFTGYLGAVVILAGILLAESRSWKAARAST